MNAPRREHKKAPLYRQTVFVTDLIMRLMQFVVLEQDFLLGKGQCTNPIAVIIPYCVGFPCLNLLGVESGEGITADRHSQYNHNHKVVPAQQHEHSLDKLACKPLTVWHTICYRPAGDIL